MATESRKATWTRKITLGRGASNCFNWSSLQTAGETTYTGIGVSSDSGTSLPNFRRIIAQGGNAVTNRTIVVTDFAFKRGSMLGKRYCSHASAKSWSYQDIEGDLAHGSVTMPSAPSSSLDTEADNAAKAAFISSARSKQTSLAGGVVMGELRETIRLVRNPLYSLRRSFDAWNRTARQASKKAGWRGDNSRLTERQSRNVQRALSEEWLKWRFGVLPLASDIEGGLKALRRLTRRNRVPTARVTGQGDKESVSISPAASNATAWNITNVLCEIQTATKMSVRYYGAVKLEMERAQAFKQEFGLQTKDFLPTVWELIPYSFVLDYFTNAGKIIEAVSFPRSDLAWVGRVHVNSVVRDGSRMVHTDSTSTHPDVGPIIVVEGFSPSAVVITRKYIQRIKHTGHLVPSLQFNLLRSGLKWLNLTALARLRSL